MTEQLGTRVPQFYLTSPAPCPYLPGRMERKVFTRLSGEVARSINDTLTHAGFRRSQNIAYRPACEACQACISVRVVVDAFEPTRSFERVGQRNGDIAGEVVDPWATEEQFALLRRALIEARGGKSRPEAGGEAKAGRWEALRPGILVRSTVNGRPSWLQPS